MKPKILFVLAGTRDKASSRVRGHWIAEELAQRGYRCTRFNARSRLDFLQLAAFVFQHDIIIFQKTFSHYHRLLQHLAVRIGKRTYLDIDDLPSRTSSPVTLRNFKVMATRAQGVIAGSRALQEYACGMEIRTHLVPSTIKLDQYRADEKLPSENEEGAPVVVGWIGNGRHYKDDILAILKPALEGLPKKREVEFRLVGSLGESELKNALDHIPGISFRPIDQIDWADPDMVRSALLGFDIGVYPLKTNLYNQYKCGFKALEYMAMGIPVVASPVGANHAIIDHGRTGFLAHTTDDWIKYLSELILNPQIRREMGARGRRVVENSFSVQAAADRLISILESDGEEL